MGTHISNLQVLGKAPSDGCTVVHILSQHELDQMVEHSAQVIHLNNPVCDQAYNNISWEVSTPGVCNIDGNNHLMKSAVFVTTYDQLHDNPKIILIGSYYSEHHVDKDWILLALIMQRVDTRVGEDAEVCVDVNQLYSKCQSSKPNIVEGNSSNHHGSHSGIYSFGAR